MKLLRKQKRKKVDNGKEKLTLLPFENEIPCEAIVKFQMRGRTTAAYLLRQGGEKSENFQFVFGFQTKGIHATLKPEQIDPIFDAIENGLKDLPPGEKFTIHFGSFSSDYFRQKHLSNLAMQTDNRPLQFLLLAEKKRVSELTQAGLRKPKFLRFYVSYTVNAETAKAGDWIEKTLAKAEGYWNKFAGTEVAIQQAKYEEVLDKAFTDGFIRWEQLLATKMGLLVEPMTEHELWEALWERFNTKDCPQLPQLTIFNGEDIEEVTHSDVHFTSHLFPDANCVPFADRAFIHVKDHYVAPLVFMDKPGGWANKNAELRYLWEIFARDAVTDTECICQLTRANEAIIKENMSRVTRQTIAAQNMSAKNAAINVGAAVRQRKAIAAQEALYEGALPLNVAVVFLVHRKTPEQLDSACRYLQNCFRRPAWVDREMEYAWKIWLQTLPTTWEKLLVTPFDRRLIYLTGEAPGFMSLVQPCPVDKVGLELIADEGGVPIHLDLYQQHRNIALFATTRAGKSVMVSGMLLHALAQGIPVIVMDFPPSDAASTFRDFTSYIGGAYFDIGKEANNLLELPDLSAFDPKEREERMVDYKEFLASALMIMCFGSGEAQTTADRMLKQAMRAVLVPAIDAFFNEPEIVARYEAAQKAGMKTPEWENTPTLVDFLSFFEEKGLSDLPSQVLHDQNTTQAVNQIKRQLRFWISSRVGRAIARPSTFDTEAGLLVFALRGLSDGDDASILALAAYSAALRRTLSHQESIFFIDEFSILLEWQEIGQLVARLTANGAKAGIRVLLAAQDPNTLATSKAGAKIIQNISTRLIGRIQPVAQQSFIDILKVEPSIIARNAGKNFYPAKEGMYSQWLLDEQSTYTFVRYYSPPILLAVVANNPHETAARRAFMNYYCDSYKGLVAFAEELAASLRESRPIRLPNGESQPNLPSHLASDDPIADESVDGIERLVSAG
ncbi:MAG: hypothetical protein KME10_25210 [Plectolyngbya sp. WJT66-NPBG17]|nr:hypothetical protein [Plectolyngbya sp. WJT66-NPBG17]